MSSTIGGSIPEVIYLIHDDFKGYLMEDSEDAAIYPIDRELSADELFDLTWFTTKEKAEAYLSKLNPEFYRTFKVVAMKTERKFVAKRIPVP